MSDAYILLPGADDGALGLNLNPGDQHYRAFVGPPARYDLISAMVFNLLTSLGLRQHHKVLDIGCGSLRVARLLIPYLNPKNYIGVEPNKWLIDDGIAHEVGQDQVRIKQPTFLIGASIPELPETLGIDYAFAQSIFSHCGVDLIQGWLAQTALHLKDSGALLATFIHGEKDFDGSGWVYPGCVEFTSATMSNLARAAGLKFKILPWAHPGVQTWALFSKAGYSNDFIDQDLISWNALIAKTKAL
jgi:SAM-dependent methyltransferase